MKVDDAGAGFNSSTRWCRRAERKQVLEMRGGGLEELEEGRPSSGLQTVGRLFKAEQALCASGCRESRFLIREGRAVRGRAKADLPAAPSPMVPSAIREI